MEMKMALYMVFGMVIEIVEMEIVTEVLLLKTKYRFRDVCGNREK